MTSDQGSDTTTREREITAASFDEANEDALSATLGDIEFVKTTLTFATLKSEPPDFDPWFHAVALFNRAQETLVSSVHLARHRVPVDAATQAIKPVRSLIPRLPEVWGSLSQAAIHTNVRAFGPSRDAGGNRVVHLFSRKADPLQDRQSLRCVSLAAALVFRAVELVLFDESSNKPGWLKLPGSSMHATATAEKLVERRYQEFTSGEQEAAQQC